MSTEREKTHMGLFKRKKEEQRLVPCPSCSQLLAVDALECDFCGADLRELPPRRPEESYSPDTAP